MNLIIDNYGNSFHKTLMTDWGLCKSSRLLSCVNKAKLYGNKAKSYERRAELYAKIVQLWAEVYIYAFPP